MCLATVDSAQACHSFQIDIIGLKILTGRRQNSWPFTSITEELNHGEWDFKYATSDFKSCTLTTWPHCLQWQSLGNFCVWYQKHIVKTPQTPTGVSIVKGLHVALYKSVSISVFVIVIIGSPHSSTSTCKGIDWDSF